MTLTEKHIEADTRPQLILVSRQTRDLVRQIAPEALSWFASQAQIDTEDSATWPLIDPFATCVALVDCRQRFEEVDLQRIGRLRARLPEASVVLLAPALNPRLHRLVQQSGVTHLYCAPIDWSMLSGHLREIARRLSESGASTFDETSLLEICLAMGSTLELTPLLEKILSMMLHDLLAHQGSILLFDRETDRLQMLASHGLPEEIAQKGYVPRKGSIAEWVIDNNQPLVLHERVDDRRFAALDGRRPISSSLCIPLRARGAVQGTINLNRLNPAPRFSDRDLKKATVMAAFAAASIENARLYEANLRAERLAVVGQTVAGISHSMRSIITSLRGGVSISEQAREHRNWDLLDQGWPLVKRNFQRLSAMALEMLDYSKSDREPLRSHFDLEPLVSEAFSTASARAAAKEITLEHQIDPSAKSLRADQDQIFRVILNLVENAVDAIEKEGMVRVRARALRAGSPGIPIALGEAPEAIFIEIQDNGPGIPPEHLENIFTPFYSTKGARGTGLGLAVTHKTIQEHGGKITVESHEGQGTTFTLVLPNARQ